MGKGGCSHSVEAEQNGSWLGLNTIASALSAITGNKWAEGSMAVKTAASRKAVAVSEPRTQPIPWGEVQYHSTTDSCWIVVKSKVYDVTEFAPNHPGGQAIVAYGGRDATDVFSAFHDPSTWSKLKDFYIGEVEVRHHLIAPTQPNEIGITYWARHTYPDCIGAVWQVRLSSSTGVNADMWFRTLDDLVQYTEQDTMLKDFRKMRAQMIRAGLFKSSKTFYAWKVLSLLGMYFTVAAILLNGQGSWNACLASSFLLGLAWQQTGWLAHDFLHHQVFNDRRINNAFGLLFGNILQGFSVDWWKSKHNTHHAVPNECTIDAAAVDPDIDTLPLLAWHEDMVKKLDSSTAQLIRYQQYLFFPLLCFARMTWAQQSFAHARLLSKIARAGSIEVGLLCVHYMTFLALPVAALGTLQGVTFFILAQVLAGFMLALVFVQSHNGMEVYLGGKDFVSAQIVSTRNIDSSLFMDWFTGGLNYQIEHHLYPTMPRHNFRRAKPMVQKFCREHGFVYESCGMDTGTYRVLQRLADIAAKVPVA